MTHLRKMVLEELERRNYTQSTTRAYIRTIEDFARYFKRPPDQLGPAQIREYIAYLFRERKLADNTVNQRVGALRFFFIKTLRKPWSVEETPYPKKRLYLPVILSQDKVGRLPTCATGHCSNARRSCAGSCRADRARCCTWTTLQAGRTCSG